MADRIADVYQDVYRKRPGDTYVKRCQMQTVPRPTSQARSDTYVGPELVCAICSFLDIFIDLHCYFSSMQETLAVEILVLPFMTPTGVCMYFGL